MMQEFIFNLTAPSKNVKEHWTKRHKRNQRIHIMLLSQNPKPCNDKKPVVEYIRYGRKMDEDNLATSSKGFIDALIKCRVIEDDSPDYIIREIRQVITNKSSERKTILRVYTSVEWMDKLIQEAKPYMDKIEDPEAFIRKIRGYE